VSHHNPSRSSEPALPSDLAGSRLFVSRTREPTPLATLSIPRLVIVGNGMVSHRLCQHLATFDPHRYEVVIFAEEARPAYDRVHLGEVLAGRTAGSLLLSPPEWYQQHRFALHLEDPIVSLDLENKQVRSGRGLTLDYDRLVLATGSAPVIPQVTVDDWRRVHLLRTLDDVERVQIEAVGRRRAVIIGGGLLGLETASTLRAAGLSITVVERSGQLMGRWLDEPGARVLEAQLRTRGVTLHLGARVATVIQDGDGKRVILTDGSDLSCDFVVLATGARPRDDLARFGLDRHPAGGFKVNRLLQTSDPNVFAIGECAAATEGPYGTVSPGYAMAACLAQTLIGRPAPYQAAPPTVRLKIAGLPVTVAGAAAGANGLVAPPRKGAHRSLRVEGGRVVAAQAVGEWKEWQRIEDAVCRRCPIEEERLDRFRRGKTLWPDQPSPSSPAALVCGCRHVNLGRIEEAVAEGCNTVAALTARTGAGAVCGSCLPWLEELVGAQRPSRPGPPMMFLGLLSLALAGGVAAGRPLLARLHPDLLASGDQLLRRPSEQRLTGFMLGGLLLLALALPLLRHLLRRRLTTLRVTHALVGLLAVGGLVVHTGLRLGVNLNLILSVSFLALTGAGSLASVLVASPATTRRSSRRLHLTLFWPALALIGLHVLTVYYF
jgi:nitrite reductase (NADH) large subunit